jgi:hypothetical protein
MDCPEAMMQNAGSKAMKRHMLAMVEAMQQNAVL